jgi:hypothetical protein
MEKIYTAQQDSHGNIIVCGDKIPRNGYRITATGSYQQCLEYKSRGKVARQRESFDAFDMAYEDSCRDACGL